MAPVVRGQLVRRPTRLLTCRPDSNQQLQLPVNGARTCFAAEGEKNAALMLHRKLWLLKYGFSRLLTAS